MKHCDKLAVTVNVTNRCNLRCGYCMASSAEEQSTPISIDLDFAKRGIKDAIEGHPTGTKVTCLRFFSPGEPTQEMPLIRECVKYALKLSPKIRTELQTNGLFASTEDAEWIANHFDIVWFSLDGPEKINDENRPDCYGQGRTKEIESNLTRIAGKTDVGVRATIVEETIDRQDEIVMYYHNLGINKLAFNPVIRKIKRKDHGKIEVTKGNVKRFAEGFLTGYNQASKLNVHLTSSLTFNFDEPTNIACRSCAPVPQLNPDGSISSCDMALYKDTKEELQPFIYGSWNKEVGKITYDNNKINYLGNRKLENLPTCKNCSIGKYCAGGCAGRVAYQTGSIYSVIPEYCLAIKYLAKHIKLGENKGGPTHP